MKKRILFLIESLSGGGAEKVLSTIVRNLDLQRFDVAVCVIVAGGKYDDEVSSQVRLCSLLKNPEAYHGIGKVWYWLKYHLIYDWLPLNCVYKLFLPQENDVEIAFVEGFATKLLSYSTNSKSKKIAWVHCDLKSQPWPIQQGIYKDNAEEADVYRRYQQVVCVSQQVEQVMRSYYGLFNTTTIYNPLDSEEIMRLSKMECPFRVDAAKFNIISVGRLERVKGYDQLIPIIRNIREKGNDVHLWIVGEGAQADALNSLVKEMDMRNHVTFTGFMKNPYSLMSQMNLFVCSSRAEGFSLVIAEALLLGLPIVSMKCAGPQELIQLCGAGNLCDSYEDLEQEILKRVETASSSKEVQFPFDVSVIIPQIEKLFGCQKARGLIGHSDEGSSEC